MSFCQNENKCPAFSLPYVVREGDTLYKIAQSYGADADDIIKANVNLNPYNLNVGMRICVPLPKEVYPQCRTTNYYIAQEGDTFFSIAAKFNVDVKELTASNVGIAPENIFDGIILCIPLAPSPVCAAFDADASKISVFNETGEVFSAPAHAEGILPEGKRVLTKKRLEAGSPEGAKELLFSPEDIGIRGESRMENSSGVFIETDNKTMLTLFNTLPVGCEMEVIK